jgi:hypothetical protein
MKRNGSQELDWTRHRILIKNVVRPQAVDDGANPMSVNSKLQIPKLNTKLFIFKA